MQISGKVSWADILQHSQEASRNRVSDDKSRLCCRVFPRNPVSDIGARCQVWGVRDAGAIAMWAALRRGFGRWVATISLVDEN